MSRERAVVPVPAPSHIAPCLRTAARISLPSRPRVMLPRQCLPPGAPPWRRCAGQTGCGFRASVPLRAATACSSHGGPCRGGSRRGSRSPGAGGSRAGRSRCGRASAARAPRRSGPAPAVRAPSSLTTDPFKGLRSAAARDSLEVPGRRRWPRAPRVRRPPPAVSAPERARRAGSGLCPRRTGKVTSATNSTPWQASRWSSPASRSPPPPAPLVRLASAFSPATVATAPRTRVPIRQSVRESPYAGPRESGRRPALDGSAGQLPGRRFAGRTASLALAATWTAASLPLHLRVPSSTRRAAWRGPERGRRHRVRAMAARRRRTRRG